MQLDNLSSTFYACSKNLQLMIQKSNKNQQIFKKVVSIKTLNFSASTPDAGKVGTQIIKIVIFNNAKSEDDTRLRKTYKKLLSKVWAFQKESFKKS